MRIKNRAAFFFLFLFPLCTYAQVEYGALKSWDPLILSEAHTTGDASYLSEDEKEVIFLSNLARMNGALFVQTFLKHYLDTCTMEYSSKFKNSLKRDLKNTPALSPFKPDETLSKVAASHAGDMGKSGKVGHNSSDGRKADERLSPLDQLFLGVGENCHYGSSQPITIVMELLIDDKISSLGHRKAMLSKEYNRVGVSIKLHKKYRFNAVMDFGRKES